MHFTCESLTTIKILQHAILRKAHVSMEIFVAKISSNFYFILHPSHRYSHIHVYINIYIYIYIYIYASVCVRVEI